MGNNSILSNSSNLGNRVNNNGMKMGTQQQPIQQNNNFGNNFRNHHHFNNNYS